MSDLIVHVVTIDDVKSHPNAERLDLAIVGGWQCVVGKDQWRAGDKAVFFAPDTVLPEAVSDRFGVTQYLHKGRIKHTRLRGEPSFGLVVKPDEDWKVGTDVAAHYGATKYEPPVRHVQGTTRVRAPEHPRFSKYTEIDNLRHYPDVFEDGEPVIITEKIHGANCRIGVIDGQIMAGSRRWARPKPTKGGEFATDDGATYWTPWEKHSGVREMLTNELIPRTWWQRFLRRPQKSHNTIILFGEVFGPSVQTFDYGLKNGELGFRLFDVMVNGKYFDHDSLAFLAEEFDIPLVPVLYRGAYSLDAVKEYAQGCSTIGGTHPLEGVVVRPEVERHDPAFGRLVFKYLSDDYLLSKHSDFTEV